MTRSSPATDRELFLAREEGRSAGRKGDTTERGLMRFGAACAGDTRTEQCVSEWLKGFEETYKENSPWKTPSSS